MTTDCTIVIDESSLSTLYLWLLSLDDDDQPQAEPEAKHDERKTNERQSEVKAA